MAPAFGLQSVAGCAMQGACAKRPMFTDTDPSVTYHGQYDVLEHCPACSKTCCWSCIYSTRESPELQCPLVGCRARLHARTHAQTFGARARVHTFIHEVIHGDFSQVPLPATAESRESASLAVIARYVLRGHVCIAAQYACCHILEQHVHGSDKNMAMKVNTRVCVLAGEILETYRIRALEGNTRDEYVITDAVLTMSNKARNVYAQNVLTFYKLMAAIAQQGVESHRVPAAV